MYERAIWNIIWNARVPQHWDETEAEYEFYPHQEVFYSVYLWTKEQVRQEAGLTAKEHYESFSTRAERVHFLLLLLDSAEALMRQEGKRAEPRKQENAGAI